MPRTYPVTFEQVTISAAQDLFEIFFPASTYKALKILRMWLNVSDQSAVPAAAFLPVRARILPSAVTNGTGGTSANIGKADPGDTAASFTAHANNTTKAVTTGTPNIEHEDGFHDYQGFDHMFDRPPIIIGGQSSSFVFELLAVPAAYSVKFSGGLEVEESG